MPEIDKRVVRYGAESHVKAIIAELDGLLRALEQPAWREALGEDWLAAASVRLGVATARFEEPFRLLVLGDFKRGKSTLVNALLGRPVVTMDIAPETMVITEIRAGATLRCEAVLEDGGVATLSPDELPSERLVQILDNLPARCALVRIEAPFTRWGDVVIIDSPGTGDLGWRFDRRVQEYLPRADAVIQVVTALSPLSESERSFLRVALRPLDLTKVTFVVNQSDLVASDADIERVVDRVRESVLPLFPTGEVFPVSAVHAFAKATAGELPAPKLADRLDAEFAQLVDALERRVYLNRDVVRNERGANEAVVSLHALGAEVQAMRAALGRDRASLEAARARLTDGDAAARAAIDARESQLRDAVNEMSTQARRWMDELVDRLAADLLPTLGRMAYTDIQRHFPFFVAETLRDGLTASVDAHQPTISALMNDLADAPDGAPSTESTVDGTIDAAAAAIGFQTPSWTFVDHVHVVANVVGLLAGPVVHLLVRAAAGATDAAQASQRGEELRRRVESAFPDLRMQVAEAVKAAYASLADALVVTLREAQEKERFRLRRELDQALTAHRHGDERVAEHLTALGAVGRRLALAEQSVSAARVAMQQVAGRP